MFYKKRKRLLFFSGDVGFDKYMAEKWDVIQRLTKVANSVTGDDSRPFVMSGGTYAHRLPNTFYTMR